MKLGFSDITSIVRNYPFLLFSLFAFWIWQLSFFQGPSFVLAKPSVLPDYFPAIAPLLFTMGLTYLVSSLQWKCVSALYGKNGFNFGMMLALVFGTALAAISPLEQIDSLIGQITCYLTGSILMGIGAALFNMQLAFGIARVPSRLIPYISVISIIGSSIALAAIMQIPKSIQTVILTVLPVIFILFFKQAQNKIAPKHFYGLGSTPFPKHPKRYYATAFMHGISMGMLFALLSIHPAGLPTFVLQPISFLMGAVLIALFVYKMRMDYNGLLYKVGIPLIAFGLLMSTLLPDAAFVGNAIYLAGYCFIYVIMVCLNIHFVVRLGFSPVYIVGFSTLFITLGEACGLATEVLCMTAPHQELVALLFGCGIAFALPVAALYCLDEKNMLSGWGSVKIDDSESGYSRKRAQRLVAAEYGLSARETEVFELVTRGNTRKGIARTLHLSEDTVKTYMRSLYAKLGVHSKQEVLDLLEDKTQE